MGLGTLDDAIGQNYQGYGERQDPKENITVQSSPRSSKVVQGLPHLQGKQDLHRLLVPTCLDESQSEHPTKILTRT